MKHFAIIASTFFALTVVHAQTAQKDLDANNVRATITNVGSLFNSGNNSTFEVPKVQGGATGKSTIFSAAPWIGGVSNGQLYLAAETYRQQGKDYQQGPVSDTYTSASLAYWNRLWKIAKIDLDTFRLRVQNGQDVSANTFKDILEWPARGNVFGGDSIHDYAPFFDVNGNHLYEPLLGDYPMIKGDQCIFTIINDDITHTESGGQSLKIDIHRMAYEYVTQDVLNNTVFVDYKLVNRSDRNYDSLVFTSWVDFDLGYYADDYVGTDSVRNMIYAYNGDPNDETISGYGSTPPAQACVLLNKSFWTSMYYNNTFDPITGNAFAASDYYAYMLGLWKDGTPKTAADTGYKTIGPLTNYSFTGDPCNNAGWWEGSAAIQPGDRRILASTAPQSFAPNQELDLALAFVYARADSGNHFASVCALQSAVDSVTKWYQQMPSTGIKKQDQPIAFALYPNPAINSFEIRGVEQNDFTVTIKDITGRTLQALSGTNESPISVSNLNPGLYIIQVHTQKGSASKRLVIH
jgi:hypothetical protein